MDGTAGWVRVLAAREEPRVRTGRACLRTRAYGGADAVPGKKKEGEGARVGLRCAARGKEEGRGRVGRRRGGGVRTAQGGRKVAGLGGKEVAGRSGEKGKEKKWAG